MLLSKIPRSFWRCTSHHLVFVQKVPLSMKEDDISIEEGGLTIRKVVSYSLTISTNSLLEKNVTINSYCLHTRHKYNNIFRSKKHFQRLSKLSASSILIERWCKWCQKVPFNVIPKKYKKNWMLWIDEALSRSSSGMVQKCTPGKKWQMKVCFGARYSICVIVIVRAVGF